MRNFNSRLCFLIYNNYRYMCVYIYIHKCVYIYTHLLNVCSVHCRSIALQLKFLKKNISMLYL